MHGTWGWASGEPQSSDSNAKRWQGQLENQGRGELSSQWETGTWDQWSTDGSVHYEEFENVMRWDDSGALEALQSARECQAQSAKGLKYPQLLANPDLYIQEIDWDSREDLKLPDYREAFTQCRESGGQRKRGRKGGGFYKGMKRENEWYNRKDDTKSLHDNTADSKLSSRPVLEPSCNWEAQVHTGQDLTVSSHEPSYRGWVDPSLRDVWAPQVQPPQEDRTRVNRASWGVSQLHQNPSYSQPYRDLSYVSGHWPDHTRTNNRNDQGNPQSRQSRYEWQQAHSAFSQEASGWVNRKDIYQSSQDWHGQGWMLQDEANWGGLPHQSRVEQSNRGSRHFNNVAMFAPFRNPRWKQQHPQQTWQ